MMECPGLNAQNKSMMDVHIIGLEKVVVQVKVHALVVVVNVWISADTNARRNANKRDANGRMELAQV